ncbi:mycothiol conjugate amidase Mca [Psychromicrobium xiongbiense]|uniref:mycothiol conjugate amidase Mca n=1 Tax=Psychromicrobium xiongbiense TaxID=3051184 RepID=UPI002555F3D1|nr:mycothiol conjugate amidase Mca [Psychromicrobium sp. YIM S02556]
MTENSEPFAGQTIAADHAATVGSSAGLRLLAVHAHPDDESSKGAATMAMYRAQGAEVMVATCTGGERGDVQNPTLEPLAWARRDMAGLRRVEMARAAAILGIEQRWLGFVDSGLPEGEPLPPLPFGGFATLPLDQAAAPLVRLVRAFRPHVIVAYDEFGGYGHPDHIMAHRVAVEAFNAAGDPARYPGTGEAWTPAKLYFDLGFNQKKFRAIHDALAELGKPSPFDWFLDDEDPADPGEHRSRPSRPPEHALTTQVECGEFLAVRDQALKAHASQVDPAGFFFAVDTEFQRTVWPWEDYSLIESRVSTELPEHDLFAGLRG